MVKALAQPAHGTIDIGAAGTAMRFYRLSVTKGRRGLSADWQRTDEKTPHQHIGGGLASSGCGH